MKNRLILMLAALGLLTGCATFSGKMMKKNAVKITHDELFRLSGDYELLPDFSYDNSGNKEQIGRVFDEYRYKKTDLDSLRRKVKQSHNLYGYVVDKKMELDSYGGAWVSLKVLDSQTIRFVLKRENIVVDSIDMKGWLKADGLFYLDNKYIKLNGVPYLFGGSESQKNRIGLAKDNGLLVNQAIDRSGAFLLIIGAGYSYNTVYHFKRME